MKEKKSPIQRELTRLEKQEKAFHNKQLQKKQSKWNQLLDDKIPEKLQSTLEAAFAGAFGMIFEKGTGIIEKTFGREELEKSFQINSYAASVRKDKKSLRVISRKAGNAGVKNLLASGTAGIGMGVLGIGIPDIVVFTGMLLKSH